MHVIMPQNTKKKCKNKKKTNKKNNNNKKTHQHQHLNHIKEQQKTFVKIFLPIINFNWLFN